MTGARYEISVDRKPRSNRDTKTIAIEAGEQRSPGSESRAQAPSSTSIIGATFPDPRRALGLDGGVAACRRSAACQSGSMGLEVRRATLASLGAGVRRRSATAERSAAPFSAPVWGIEGAQTLGD
jgi:hypothetical protein